MDKTQLKRHTLVYISLPEKQRIWQSLAAKYEGRKRELAEEILLGAIDVPGIARRGGDEQCGVPIGFVHQERIAGNRIRIGTYAMEKEIVSCVTPYELLKKSIITRTACMEAAAELAVLGESYGLRLGVLGSAGLELATGLPYTDAASDLDFLIKPAGLAQLEDFYAEAKARFKNINMDFEVDLPNGFGIKLAEMFMKTRTVLGKSIDNVDLLYKKDIMQYFK